MSEEKITPLDEKRKEFLQSFMGKKGFNLIDLFEEIKKQDKDAVQGLIAEFKDDVYHGYEIQTIIKKHFGRGLTDD